MNTPRNPAALALAGLLQRRNMAFPIPAASVALDITEGGDLLVSLLAPNDTPFAVGTIDGDRLYELIAALMGMAERLDLLADCRGTA